MKRATNAMVVSEDEIYEYLCKSFLGLSAEQGIRNGGEIEIGMFLVTVVKILVPEQDM